METEHKYVRRGNVARGLLVSAVGLFVTICIVGLSVTFWLWSEGPRSELSNWLEATSTLAAFLAAAIAAWYANGAFKLQSRRQRAIESEEAKKAQAKLLECRSSTKTDGRRRGRHGVYVHNRSKQSFEMVEVWPSLGNDSLDAIKIGVLKPSGEPIWFPFSPQDQRRISRRRSASITTFMHLVDANQRDWYRYDDGYLRRPSNPFGTYN